MITPVDMGWVAGWLDSGATMARTGRDTNTHNQGWYVNMRASGDGAANAKLRDLVPTIRIQSVGRVTEYNRRACAEHCPVDHVHVVVRSQSKGQVQVPFGTSLILMDNLAPHSVFAARVLPILASHHATSRQQVVRGWSQMAARGWYVRPEWQRVSRDEMRKILS